MKYKKIIIAFLLLVILFFAYNRFKYRSVGNLHEGERFDTGFDGFKNMCEKGLTPISDSVVLKDSCGFPMCKCYVCTKCGDGVCGEGENSCNCKKDCK